MTKRAFDGLKELPHVHVLGSDRAEEHTGILTFTIDDVHPHDVSEILIAMASVCVPDITVRSRCLIIWASAPPPGQALCFTIPKKKPTKFVAGIASIRERMGYGK